MIGGPSVLAAEALLHEGLNLVQERLAIAADAGLWIRRVRHDGVQLFGIPSSKPNVHDFPSADYFLLQGPLVPPARLSASPSRPCGFTKLRVTTNSAAPLAQRSTPLYSLASKYLDVVEHPGRPDADTDLLEAELDAIAGAITQSGQHCRDRGAVQGTGQRSEN
jgi:hypothetical protein